MHVHSQSIHRRTHSQVLQGEMVPIEWFNFHGFPMPGSKGISCTPDDVQHQGNMRHIPDNCGSADNCNPPVCKLLPSNCMHCFTQPKIVRRRCSLVVKADLQGA